MTWEAFVIAYGRRARRDHLAFILQESAETIDRLRRRGVCQPGRRRDFAELFTLWNGRHPRDDEWPRPWRFRRRGQYEWQLPEQQLLATLVGRMSPREIAAVLTRRLQQVTGDDGAVRSRQSIQIRINRIGLQASDIAGAITVAAAGTIIGSRSILDHEIRAGKLRVVRVGRYVAIPHDEFERWQATRVFPPKGFVKLTTLKRPLGFTSDKLSEMARAGKVPSAIRCNPSGTGEKSTQFGTWYIDPKVARKLIADRRAGRPMPWWGTGDLHNLTVTYRLWQQRQHPPRCATCQTIWGPAGPPRSFEDYVKRYPPIAFGAKRHLTRPYSDGFTLEDVSRDTHVSVYHVQRAIQTGALRASRVGHHWYVSRMDATRWKARRCPTGERETSWIALPTARKLYDFTLAELRHYIAAGRLTERIGDFGAQIGVRLVLRQQCRELRDELWFSEREAARRVGVSIARLRVLLRGLEWRPAPRIPAEVVHSCTKRLRAKAGLTIAEAARRLRKSRAWVLAEINAGTARVIRTKWDCHRRYISAPMFKRLQAAARHPRPRVRWTRDWLHVGRAAHLAGVSSTTIARWADAGDVRARPSDTGRRYHRRSVITKARRYWLHEARTYKRPRWPAWLQEEQRGAAAA